MPVYEYECTRCGRIVEAFQRFSDKPLTRCSHCSGKLKKLISQCTFHLKGTGWYVTDYASGSRNTQGGSEKKTKTESGKTSSKSETPSTGKSDQ